MSDGKRRGGTSAVRRDRGRDGGARSVSSLTLAAVLVTNNDAHFRRVSGLKVVNWLK